MWVVVLDTSGPISMVKSCGDAVTAEAGRIGRKERPEGPPPHVACCTTTASARTCRGWGFPGLDCLTAEQNHLVDLGVFVEVDRQES